MLLSPFFLSLPPHSLLTFWNANDSLNLKRYKENGKPSSVLQLEDYSVRDRVLYRVTIKSQTMSFLQVSFFSEKTRSVQCCLSPQPLSPLSPTIFKRSHWKYLPILCLSVCWPRQSTHLIWTKWKACIQSSQTYLQVMHHGMYTRCCLYYSIRLWSRLLHTRGELLVPNVPLTDACC